MKKLNRTVYENIKFLMHLIWMVRKDIFFYTALYAVVNSIMPFVYIYLPKLLITEFTTDKRFNVVLMIIVGASLAILIGRYLVFYANNNFDAIYVWFKAIMLSGEKFMDIDFERLEDPKVLNLNQKSSEVLKHAEQGIFGLLIKLFNAAGAVFVLSGCIYIIFKLHFLIVFALISLVMINFFVNSKSKTYEHKIKEEISPINRFLGHIHKIMYSIEYGKDIRIFNVAPKLIKKYNTANTEKHNLMIKIYAYTFSTQTLFTITAMFQEIILYVYLVYRVLYTGMDVADYVMYSVAIRTFMNVLGEFFNNVAIIRQRSKDINHIQNFLEIEEDIVEDKLLTILPDINKEYKIEFDKVSFKYPNSVDNKYALNDISITIEPGQKLAVVGLNGAGKSTFIKLLINLYKPSKGQIKLNNINIQKYNKNDYYSLFSVVFQEVQMFALSVAENISMKDYSETNLKKVNQSIYKAGMSEKINSLIKGYKTSVLKTLDEDGIEFSGGETQKLSLARALYKNAPIIILDEPTSALDAIAESKMFNDFNKLIGNKTAIYISHRLSSTRFCDKIALFSDGKIIEYGSHEELIKANKEYAKMFKMQSQYYIESENGFVASS